MLAHSPAFSFHPTCQAQICRSLSILLLTLAYCPWSSNFCLSNPPAWGGGGAGRGGVILNLPFEVLMSALYMLLLLGFPPVCLYLLDKPLECRGHGGGAVFSSSLTGGRGFGTCLSGGSPEGRYDSLSD